MKTAPNSNRSNTHSNLGIVPIRCTLPSPSYRLQAWRIVILTLLGAGQRASRLTCSGQWEPANKNRSPFRVKVSRARCGNHPHQTITKERARIQLLATLITAATGPRRQNCAQSRSSKCQSVLRAAHQSSISSFDAHRASLRCRARTHGHATAHFLARFSAQDTIAPNFFWADSWVFVGTRVPASTLRTAIACMRTKTSACWQSVKSPCSRAGGALALHC